jgi:hypothetical protein
MNRAELLAEIRRRSERTDVSEEEVEACLRDALGVVGLMGLEEREDAVIATAVAILKEEK